MNEPLRISVAPNGARRSKQDHPAIPLTPAELAIEAEQCADAGAVLLHLHVRDSNGKHTLSADIYRYALDAIRHRVGSRLLLQITTESVGMFDLRTQMDTVLAVRPPAASFAIRELIPDVAAEPQARDFFATVAANGTVPQFILYHPDEIDRLRALQASGVIPFSNADVLFVLGRYTDNHHPGSNALVPFLSRWGTDPTWTVCAFGAGELAIAAAAIGLGGHIRVGFENNLQRPDGSILSGNAEQVAAVAALARTLGRPLAMA
ncbi:MAG TPA: 3-keto-5-aminohexanoate cleavage protein [Steroidobacteraceae bacterium]